MEFLRHRLRTLRQPKALWGLAVCVGALSACDKTVPPRNFADFMEDRIAREGTLARCNANQEATLNDIECANARRAAAAIALRRERDRREALERESAAKLDAIRDEFESRERAAQSAAAIAKAEQERAYEAMWDESGSPLEPVAMPSRVALRSTGSSVTAGTQSEEGTAGAELEEMVVPSKFSWRPAID
jgi:hypothetical protein